MINLAIFRVPPEAFAALEDEFEQEGTVPDLVLMQVPIVEGQLAENGRLFGVMPGDGYETLQWNQIVLAEEIAGGSVERGIFSIGPDDVKVYQIGSDLRDLVVDLLEELK